MTRQRSLVTLAVVAVGVAAILTTMVVRGHSGSRHRTNGTLPQADAMASQRLTDLVKQGEQVTHHATYAVVGDPATVQGMLSLEVWRRGDLLRQDTVRRVGTETVRTSSLRLATGPVLCTQQGSRPWSCTKQRSSSGVADASNPASLLAGLPNLATQVVTTRQATLSGRTVQCFTINSLEMCVTKDGIPARISSPNIRFEMTSLQTTVAETVFAPPTTPR